MITTTGVPASVICHHRRVALASVTLRKNLAEPGSSGANPKPGQESSAARTFASAFDGPGSQALAWMPSKGCR